MGGGDLLKATHTVKRIFFNSERTTLKICKIKGMKIVQSKEKQGLPCNKTLTSHLK
jgi:hypothetical protein